MRHIMIAHDLSQQADTALLRAHHLAEQHSAKLTVLHVLEDHLPKPVLEQNKAAARAMLEQRLAEFGIAADLVLVIGRPAQSIVEQQKARSADLLVMGDHHQSSPHYFSGTTLERVLQRSTSPVLLAINSEPARYQRALVSMDFSRCACNALHYTHAVLESTAQIHAVHVLEQAEVHERDLAEREWQQELFEQLIVDECKKMPSEGAAVTHALYQGELYSCMDTILQEQRPQLFALGKHGRGVLADALLGSMAQYFLENPPCDVLLVK